MNEQTHPMQDQALRLHLYQQTAELLNAISNRDAHVLRRRWGISTQVQRAIDEELQWLQKNGRNPVLHMPPLHEAFEWARGSWPFCTTWLTDPVMGGPGYRIECEVYVDGQATDEILIAYARQHGGRQDAPFIVEFHDMHVL